MLSYAALGCFTFWLYAFGPAVTLLTLGAAGEEARFATPGVQIGLFCSTPMVALSRNLSRKAAMAMLLTAELADAAEAKDLGLVNRAQHIGIDADIILVIQIHSFERQLYEVSQRVTDPSGDDIIISRVSADLERGQVRYRARNDAE